MLESRWGIRNLNWRLQ